MKTNPSQNRKVAAILQIKTQEKEFRFSARELLDLIPLKHGKILDVGCGIGWVVDEAINRGFQAVGIDSCREYVEEGKKKLKVDLRVSPLEKFRGREKYDIVILKHVLEHIIDPKKFLTKVSTLLTARGYLIVSCPNINSLMARIFLEKWYGLVPMEHRWHYTKNNLPKLLVKNGFVVEKVIHSNMWYKTPGLKGFVIKLILLIADITNSGDLITVIARKK